MVEPRRLTCATRAIKNARYLQSVAPNVIPETEPTSGFGSIIPLGVLAEIHNPDNPHIDDQLATRLSAVRFPTIRASATGPLFKGTLVFVRIDFTDASTNRVFSLSPPDFQTAIDYATLAAVPISQYASQFGVNKVDVSNQTVPFQIELVSNAYNDGMVRNWVNSIASQLPGSVCLVIPSPLGVINLGCAAASGCGGYHQKANVPYIFVNVLTNDRLAISDPPFAYAGLLSHEIAEMVVDPNGDFSNPEVCDPCGPNCASTYLSYFDGNSTYITTSQQFPPDFQYTFYINAIMRPGTAPCPASAPASACSYSPIETGRAALGTFPAIVSVGGFFSPDDNYRHAIVATKDGKVTEVFFNPQRGQGQAVLGTFPGIVGVGGFFSADDDCRHAMVAGADGKLIDLYFNPLQDVRQLVVATVPDVVAVAGFHSVDDGFRHAIVGTKDGNVSEVFFNPG